MGTWSGASGATTPPDDGAADELLEAAVAEGGNLSIYTGWLNAESVVEAFTERYPEISVELSRASAGTIATRFASEYEADVHAADVLELGDVFMQEANPEWFDPLDASLLPNLSDYPEEAIRVDGLAVDTAYNAVAFIIYNTDLVDEEEVPDTWEGLTDDRWAGQLAWVHPGASPAFMNWANYARGELGDEYLTALVEQDPLFTESLIPAGQQVASGAVALAFPGGYQAIAGLQAEGAPVDAKLIDAPFGMQATMSASIPAEAPHPAAARLFLNWLLSAEGQAVHCSGGATAIIPVDDDSCLVLPGGFLSASVAVTDADEQAVLELVGAMS